MSATGNQVDLNKTFKLLQGGLLSPTSTWQDWLDEAPDWRQSMFLLAGPMLLVNSLMTALTTAVYADQTGFLSGLLLSLIGGACSLALLSFIAAFLAGHWGGKNDFNRAFAAVSIASVPGFLGAIAGSLIPFLGTLLSAAGAITSLVFLWKIFPLALATPDEKRILHFLASIGCVVLVNFIIGLSMLSPSQQLSGFEQADSDTFSGRASGFIGGIERQARLLEKAESSTYTPPKDGKLTASQVERYAEVMRKTSAAQERYAQQVQQLQRASNKEESTLGQMSALSSGLSGIMNANNAEMEIVLSRKQNWAEHLWVKEQIHAAMLNGGEGPGAIPHNYKLWLPHAEALASESETG